MSKAIVAKAIEDILAAGVSIAGPVGAFGISNLVAYRLGLGVLAKPRPTENNAIVNGKGYAADIVMSPSGMHWDILIDGGGRNEPTFDLKDNLAPSGDYRAPLQDYPIKFETDESNPEPIPVPQPVDLSEILIRLDQIQDQLTELKTDQDNLAGFASDLNKFVRPSVDDILKRQDRPLSNGWLTLSPRK